MSEKPNTHPAVIAAAHLIGFAIYVHFVFWPVVLGFANMNDRPLFAIETFVVAGLAGLGGGLILWRLILGATES